MTLPAWWDNKREKQNARSRQQERSRAKETGGRVMPGSGSSWRARGDVKTADDLEQDKYTDKAQYPLKAAELESVLADALLAGREPTLVIEFSRYGLRLVGTVERTQPTR